MKITYDEKQDILRILISESPIETVRQNGADQTLDYDQDGVLVGVEMRNTLQYMPTPNRIEMAGIVPTGAEPRGANAPREKRL